jgi:hypothetical protein
VNARGIGRGAVVGLLLVIPVTIVLAVLEERDPDFDESGWRVVLWFALLLAFGAGGWVAGRLDDAAPLSNGALAGLGALLLWLPVRVVIWALRDDARGLVGGDDAVLRPTQLFAAALFAAAAGLIGGWLAARREAGA